MVIGGACDERRLQQRLELQVHQACCHLGALQRPADPEEVPAFVMRQGRISDTEEAMAAEFHCFTETVRSAGDLLRWIKPRDRVIQSIHVFPHLARNAVADGAGILARFGDALHDGIGIVAAKREEVVHGLRVGLGIELEEALLLARHDDEWVPPQPVRGSRLLEKHVVVDVEDARGVLGALHVTRQPEHRIRDARQHYATQDSSPRTQVSLLPPPWEEFTTNDPGCNATRVSPPGMMVTFCPSYKQKGRRSTCRPHMRFVSTSYEGTRDKPITGCAM